MKLAIFGAGMIVSHFLEIVGDIPEIELKAILGTEADLEKMEQYKESFGIENIYTDVDLCLENTEIDTVYIGLPNHLHYSYAKKALEQGKNVICEKPFTLKLHHLLELEKIALSKKLVLVEAITNQYLSNYKEIKKDLKQVGDLKIIECNYSQYSSRYDSFKKGIVLPAFNSEMGGGALMDINIYNIHFVVGLMGMPEEVHYFANIERNIDTSGMLVLQYKDVKAVCIGAKDSTAEIRSTIQGTKGSITVEGPTNVLDRYSKDIRSGKSIMVDQKVHPHRMFEEFKEFERIISEKDMDFVKKQLDHGKKVLSVVEAALLDAGITLG